MSRVANSLLLLRARAVEAVRWFRQHAFVLLVLAPLILVPCGWILIRWAPLVATELHRWLELDTATPAALAWILALFVTVPPLRTALDELYPPRRTMLDALPVAVSSRLVTAIITTWVRQLPLLVALVVALVVLGFERPELAIAHLAMIISLSTAVALALATLLVRLRWLDGRALVPAAVWLGAALVAQRPPWLDAVLAPWRASAVQIDGLVRAIADQMGSPARLAAPDMGVVLTIVIALGLATIIYLRDYERGRELVETILSKRARRSTVRLRQTEPTPHPVRVGVARDMRLVIRLFSPAVVVTSGLTFFWLLAAVLAPLVTPIAWHERATFAAGTMAVLSSVALVPVLVQHQLPRLWAETVSGIEPSTVWRTKLWSARLLAVPATLLVILLIATRGTASALPNALLFAAMAWCLASLVGGAAYEIPERPLIGFLFSAMVGTALAGLLIIVPDLWLMWLIGFLVVIATFTDRANGRIQLLQTQR
ncbi:MAG: hypothetical protein AAGD38_15915 [Acidobacteriota bacterium]